MFVAAAVLLLTAVLAGWLGPLAIGALAVLGFLQLRLVRLPVFLVVLLLALPVYVAARTSGWNNEQLIDYVRRQGLESRADSLAFRAYEESRLIKKAWGRPAFGYGDTGEARKVPVERRGERRYVVIDSLWIACLGMYGIVGVTALFAVTLLPPLRLLARSWHCDLPGAAAAPGIAAVLMLVIYVWAGLTTEFPNAVLPMVAGALMGWVPQATAVAPGPGHRETEAAETSA
jgi:hypothetical protein